MIKKSFALRVLVISFLLVALPLLINSFIFFQRSYEESIRDAEKKLKAEADFKSFALFSFLPLKSSFLKELGYILNLQEALNHPDQEKLNLFLREIPAISTDITLSILKIQDRRRFQIIASNNPALVNTQVFSYRGFKNVFEKGKGGFLRYQYSEEKGRVVPYIFLAQVIFSKNNEPLGLIVASQEVEEALRHLLLREETEEGINFALVNANNIVFAATDPDLEGNYFNPLSEAERQEIVASGQIGRHKLAKKPLPLIERRDPPYFEFIYKDQVQIAFRSEIELGKFTIMSYSAKEQFFGAAVRHFLFIYTVYGLILVVGGGITYWLALWLARPLRQLTQKMEEVGQGNLNVRFNEEPNGFEINLLGSIFNETLDTLLDNIQRTQDERIRKEKYQKELAIGRSVQNSLLPTEAPDVKGIKFAAAYLPAGDVGGDFYAYLKKKLKTGEEALMISVGDSAGRGISTCLYALSLRGLLRSYATLYDDLGVILSASNNDFIVDCGETGMFATLFYAMYQADEQKLTYYSCGHVPAILRRGSGQVSYLATSGIGMGLKPSTPFTPDTVQLSCRDMVVIYTDGLLEVRNEKNEAFTRERLLGLIQKKEWEASEFVEAIKQEVRSFTQGISQDEEIVVVALKVESIE